MSQLTQVAEIAATAVSLFLSGAITSVSMLTIPVALETSPSHDSALQKWKTIYLRGHIQGPAIATVAGLAHAAVAYSKWSAASSSSSTGQELDNGSFSLVAAAATAAIVPYTWTVMPWVNGRLMTAANTGVGAENARRWMVTWSRMNVVRGVLPLVGGVFGLLSLRR